MSTLPVPLKETEPETSPLSAITLAVCSAVAVSALPVTFPISGAVTAANWTDEDVPTA